MSSSDRKEGWAPAFPTGTALAVFVLAALALCWPMLQGQFLVGPNSDQYATGYALRDFEAQAFRQTGHVPQWNPYLFGGSPFIASIPHDIYYVTAWLRWLLPTDVAMTVGFFIHLAFAGLTMFALLRRLKVQWTGAMVGGLAYEMSGIVASLVKPGHDGKMFVSAWAPLAFLGLLVAFRERRRWGYALLALAVGAGMLATHFQMMYYLLVSSALFALWLAFFDEDQHPEVQPVFALTGAAFAVLLGLCISGIQSLPFIEYLPFAARGASGGWEYATSYAMPVEELMVGILPQFNGILENYWGSNFVKLHSEFLGILTIGLAVLGATDKVRGRIRWIWLVIAGLALLIAFGGHTPFYRVWYELMPMMKKVRAAGMAFYLVALVVCIFAGYGTDRLLRRSASALTALWPLAVLAILGIIGAVGGLQPLAEALARPEVLDRAITNGEALRLGSIRLLAAALMSGGLIWLILRAKLKGGLAAAALLAVVFVDQWSIDHLFYEFSPPAAQTFGDDAITRKLKATPQPYRVLDAYPGQVYEHSILMGYGVSQTFGYHGNEIRFYDELWGGKNEYRNTGRPGLWDLWAVKFVLLPQPVAIPGYHQVLGPVPTAQGRTGYLMERDSVAPYARVVVAAAKVPDDQSVAAVIDQRFPVRDLIVIPDTAQVDGPTITSLDSLPPLTPLTASVDEWAPGRMHVSLHGVESRPTWLLISENWYPDWHAIVDNQAAKIYRANHAMLALPLPAGAKSVDLSYRSDASAKGATMTEIALALTLLLFLTSPWQPRLPSFKRSKKA